MEKIIILAFVFASAIAHAATEVKMNIVCHEDGGLEDKIRLETVNYTTVTKVEIRKDNAAAFELYASNRSITETGSLLTGPKMIFRAASKATGNTDSCYKMGTELNGTMKARLGNHGQGAIYLFTFQYFPRFYVKKGQEANCPIPRPMPAKPFQATCRVQN